MSDEHEELYMQLGPIELRYQGDDLEAAWERAKAGVDAYLDARDTGGVDD